MTTRNLYLVSFKYNTNSEFYKTMEQFYNTVNGVNGVKDQAQDVINDAKDKLHLKRDNEQTFLQIRVGYHALCLETSNGWHCARFANQFSNQNVSHDPLHLVSIAGIYKDNIIRSLPLWVTILLTAFAYIVILADALSIPYLTDISLRIKQISVASALAFAAISTFAAMVVSGVVSSSTSTIIGTVTLGVIEVHTGGMILGIGWMLFALILLVNFLVCWKP